MGRKPTKNPLIQVYVSLTFEELSTVERYMKLLNVQYKTSDFSRSSAIAYAIKNELQPKVERAEAIVAAQSSKKKNPPLETGVANLVVEDVSDEAGGLMIPEEKPVTRGGFNP